ncbi:hypothetical protein CBER1_06377 [Cercospora berteroae]|uniref:F-box domain-containing protein n=1 Tax=Cercospora berteroae TaxID=357750 RepID=A0A2S6C943_9PEZI|nr:hypothetical protein CBER1_06377 [Cercospora berteroae]
MPRSRIDMSALTKKLAPTPSNRFQALATHDDPWQNGGRKFCETCRTTGHTEEEHAAIPDPDAKTSIQTLPAELRLDILSMLSPTEIQRFRGVSKDSQELVDAPDNRTALFPTREKFEQQYLADSDGRQIWSMPIYRYLTKIGECLVQAYIDEHYPDLSAPKRSGWTRKMRDVYNHHAFIAHIDTPEHFVGLQHLTSVFGLPLSREQLFQWYMDIKARKEPALPAWPPSVRDKSDSNRLLRIPFSGDPCLEKSEFPITSLIYWNQNPESQFAGRDEWLKSVGGRCSTRKLSQILRENFPKLFRGVGICVRTKWAYDLITKAKHNKKIPLTDWERAAILEQLYLYTQSIPNVLALRTNFCADTTREKTPLDGFSNHIATSLRVTRSIHESPTMEFIPRNLWDLLPFADDLEQETDPLICQICADTNHTEEEHAAVPTASATTTIESLPAELKLDILSRLKPRDIMRCRDVSTDFRQLVNAPENDSALLRKVQQHEHSLVDARYFVGTPEAPSMPAFVFAYLARRGLWKALTHTRINIDVPVTQWASNHSPAVRRSERLLKERETNDQIVIPQNGYLPMIEWLVNVANALVQAYMDTHCPTLTIGPHNRVTRDLYGHEYPTAFCEVDTVQQFLEVYKTPIWNISDTDTELKRWALKIDRDELRQYYLDIKARKEPKLPSRPSNINKSDNSGVLRIPLSGDTCLETPKLHVTRIEHWQQHPEIMAGLPSGFRFEKDGWFRHEELEKALGVTLPELGLHGAYCVRTRWAVDTLRKTKKGKVLSKWARAALLDELWLF